MRNIHMDPDARALSAQLYHWCAKRVRRSFWSTQVTLRAEPHGGDCWTSTIQGPQDGSVLCCRNGVTAGSR